MRTVLWTALSGLLVASSAHAQGGALRSAPDTTRVADELPVPRLWRIDLSLGSVYDSNIDHDEAYLRSYGMVAGLGGRWQSRADDPALVVEYETAAHSYTGTDRWNRVSHHLRGAFEREIDDWTLEAVADVSLKGSSDDRSIRDEYTLEPGIEYELGKTHLLRLGGALRYKDEEDDGRDSFNRYLEAEFGQEMDGGQEWTVGYRLERNTAREERNDYDRWTASLDYETPLGELGELELEVKYRSKFRPNRMVEVDDEDVPRHDHYWIPSAAWTQAVGRGLAVRVDYRYETRTSNDPEEYFDAHLVSLTLLRRW